MQDRGRGAASIGALPVALVATLVTTLAGCAGGQNPSPPRASAPPSYGPNVVHYAGVRDLRFGETERALTERGAVVRDVPECGPRMTRATGLSPVFVGGRLVLVWADPPLRTPEGIGVGDGVAKVRAAYPSAESLAAPAGSYRFSGLLATSRDRAYLFLHDGQAVRKLIVGYADHARRLFERGFAGC